MNFLRRYSALALVVLSAEVLLLYFFRTPLKDESRVPRTFEEVVFSNNIFSSSMLPSLFSSSDKPATKKPVSGNKNTLLEQKLIASGLVNIKTVDPSVVVNLKYATDDNFLHKNMYGTLQNCYLQKDIAAKVATAQKILKTRFPFYSLIIYDGVRPLSIQKMMWDELQVPENMKDKYVSNPEVGSLHNYGCAVDVSIVNEEGWEMDMGTSYDYFGELGHPIAEHRMINEGKLTYRQFENRRLLREVMTEAGFMIITTEWWHFNGCYLKQAGEKYNIVQ